MNNSYFKGEFPSWLAERAEVLVPSDYLSTLGRLENIARGQLGPDNFYQPPPKSSINDDEPYELVFESLWPRALDHGWLDHVGSLYTPSGPAFVIEPYYFAPCFMGSLEFFCKTVGASWTMDGRSTHNPGSCLRILIRPLEVDTESKAPEVDHA